MRTSTRPRRLLARAALAGSTLAVLVAPAAPTPGSLQQRERARPIAVTLEEVRALFGRVDADEDGRLDVREADHGGLPAEQLAWHDQDGDRALSLEEFVVARHRQLARAEGAAAADLQAESTRIQAKWRAQALARKRGAAGPAARVAVAREDEASRSAATPSEGSPSPRAWTTSHRAIGAPPRELEELLAERGRPASDVQARRRGPGPGLTRLQGAYAAGPAAAAMAQPLPSLEERARVAQELLSRRLLQSRPRTPPAALGEARPAPGSRGEGRRDATPVQGGPAPDSGDAPAPRPPEPEAGAAAPPPSGSGGPGSRRASTAPSGAVQRAPREAPRPPPKPRGSGGGGR